MDKGVFVLLQYYIEDTDIVGVFSNKELAEKAKNDLEQIKDAKYYNYVIEWWEMDKLNIQYH